jgi:hypothetical protein
MVLLDSRRTEERGDVEDRSEFEEVDSNHEEASEGPKEAPEPSEKKGKGKGKAKKEDSEEEKSEIDVDDIPF